jgi:hypothetical protein
LGPIAEQVRMEFPEDLGQRIVEAARLAAMLHVQQSVLNEFIPGGTGKSRGGAVPSNARTRGGASVSTGHVSLAEPEAA